MDIYIDADPAVVEKTKSLLGIKFADDQDQEFDFNESALQDSACSEDENKPNGKNTTISPVEKQHPVLYVANAHATRIKFSKQHMTVLNNREEDIHVDYEQTNIRLDQILSIAAKSTFVACIDAIKKLKLKLHEKYKRDKKRHKVLLLTNNRINRNCNTVKVGKSSVPDEKPNKVCF